MSVCMCVCETICLSDTFVHSAKTNKHTFTFFSRQMSPHTKQSYFSWETLVSIYLLLYFFFISFCRYFALYFVARETSAHYYYYWATFTFCLACQFSAVNAGQNKSPKYFPMKSPGEHSQSKCCISSYILEIFYQNCWHCWHSRKASSSLHR